MASQETVQMAHQAAQMMEAIAYSQDQILDKQIEDLNNMKEDDLEALRARRRQNMIKEQEKNRELRAIGHGSYDELANQEDFFAAVKKSTQMVVHFYRNSTERCKIVDARVRELVPKYIKTRFCKIDAEKAPFLVNRLNIFVMPTLLLVKDCQTVHQIRGFDELGGTDEFSSDYLAYVLSGHGVCNYDGPPPALPTANKLNIFQMPKSSIRQSAYANDSDDDFSD